jgi:uncharacterized protein YicC (UPF0701 family)
VHLDELGLMLDKGGSVGRPLDFLIQEITARSTRAGARPTTSS